MRRVVLHTPDQWRLAHTQANGAPAFAMYKRAPDGSYRAHGLDVLSLTGGLISHIVAFNDPSIVAKFGLPETFTEPPGAPARGKGVRQAVPDADDIDELSLLAAAAQYLLSSILLVRGADLPAPTPCPGWDLRHLLRHLRALLADAAYVLAER